jgi:hypothetical protein
MYSEKGSSAFTKPKLIQSWQKKSCLDAVDSCFGDMDGDQ